MNQTKKWLGALALIIICAFTFSACGGDDDDDNGGSSNTTSLVGTWRMDFGTNSYVLLTLNQDGTGRYREYDHDYWQHDDSFTYTYSNGVVAPACLAPCAAGCDEGFTCDEETNLCKPDHPDLSCADAHKF